MRSAVPQIAVFGGIGTDGAFLTVADGFELIAGNSESNQSIFGGAGAAVAKTQVVFSGAAFIAMAFNRHDEIGIHLEDGLQSAGIALQDGLILRPDIALIVVEVKILHLLSQNFLYSLRGSGRRGLRGRRSAHRDGGIGFRTSTRASGSQVIGGRGSGINTTAAIGAYLANGIVDLNTCGISHGPAQR